MKRYEFTFQDKKYVYRIGKRKAEVLFYSYGILISRDKIEPELATSDLSKFRAAGSWTEA